MTYKELLCEIQMERHPDFDSFSDESKIYYLKNAKSYINKRFRLLFSETPDFENSYEIEPVADLVRYKTNPSNDEDHKLSLFSEKELDTLVTVSQTQEERSCEELIEELTKLISMYWYVLLLFHRNIAINHKEQISKIKNILKKAADDSFSNRKVKTTRINQIYNTSENQMLWEVYEYFKDDENSLYEIPCLYNLQRNDLPILIKRQKNLYKMAQNVQKIIGRYARKKGILIERNYDNFLFFPKKPCPISEKEIEFIKYFLSLIPDKDISLFDSLKKDKWEVIPLDCRITLLNYIEELSSDINVMNKYLNAKNHSEFLNKISDVEDKLLHPSTYRLKKKLEEIDFLVSTQDISDETMESCHKYTDHILKLLAHEQSELSIPGYEDQLIELLEM